MIWDCWVWTEASGSVLPMTMVTATFGWAMLVDHHLRPLIT